jgi:hypothetical protein
MTKRKSIDAAIHITGEVVNFSTICRTICISVRYYTICQSVLNP